MAIITLDKVRKVYAGGVEAVKGVSIDIADGEFIVLVGPSGCGKSTLLRMVAGLEEISDGEIRIGERVVNRVEPADRDIAMVFQNYALYPHMSVYDNLAYGLRNRGTAKSEIDARVKEAARILEIGDFLDRKPRQLSGGQRQRVAMGRAIVRKPAAFLFDEPLSNLDAKLRVQMRIEIKRLQEALGTTSVYVTHDQLEAMTLAHRLVVLNHGRIEQIGTPLEVYEKPASTFVAGFIGSPAMNIIPVKSKEGRLHLESGEGLDAPDGFGAEKALLGVRPEDLKVDFEGGSSDDALSLSMKVIAVEPVGAESYVHGRMSGVADDVVVRVPAKAEYAAGVSLSLKAPRDRLHIFDAANGQRLNG
ncbi:sn-glycerol-3-phosphate import ATP-binding protein UgpC [Rhizobiales bacterium]|uniref:sn-glycerol-3-phosphate import ATP-binding protein UgpC n=1 Tax=Hongsoonwoonella zoysiae TaxID=2821844 RepID=UPI0015614D43|nr:sn-glycerol-3-phosphate import ATP-binding protein UgpC [Hongsoonwoonella zoysiae]NRG16449.1 sn-glycerol-3-phosphate import ATP-binding protein UgpC [Hongsoonwoonella zoysiae]